MIQHRPGDFVAVRTTGWAAFLIRLGTRSPVNHVALLMPDGRLFEAKPHGAGYVAGNYYNNLHRSWSDVDLTDEQRQKVCEWAASKDGTEYGWGDIIAISLSSLHLKFPGVEARLHSPNTAICSQLVAEAYAAAGVTLVPGKAAYDVTPGDLLDVIDGVTVPADY